MKSYTCPMPSCNKQRLLRDSITKEFICYSCKKAYIIDRNNKPTLKDPMVKPKVKPRGTEESDIQQAVIEWAEVCKYKDILKHLHHSPNGGARSESEGARFKREGVKAGYPDLVLNVSRQGYNGLFIEMKTPKGRLSKKQKEWRDFLINEGNSWHLCRSFDEARKVIEWYLD